MAVEFHVAEFVDAEDSDGDYDWSDEKTTTQRTSLRCNNSGAVITHHWIDTY
ncbi:hypothetical protein [Streptomyces sp. NPDC005989]|uniref:hypothetical protein n=1 Tax=Streptomyces sp. NPDC005989 TaxID=3156727 RepID=UPI0033D0EBF8